MGKNIDVLPLCKIILAGIGYKNDRTELYVNKKARTVEYHLYELDQNKLAYKFVIHQKDIEKVRMTPRTIQIQFKALSIMVPFDEDSWKKKGILKNK